MGNPSPLKKKKEAKLKKIIIIKKEGKGEMKIFLFVCFLIDFFSPSMVKNDLYLNLW